MAVPFAAVQDSAFYLSRAIRGINIAPYSTQKVRDFVFCFLA